ncbi:MAG: MarR family transcriptional regulator [Candidatus Doudnabacteria bacterium]
MAESKSLKLLLFSLVKQAKADIERQFTEAGISITPFQYGVLSILKYSPITLADIAKKLGIRSPSLVPYIDELQKKGMISRHADKQDRRKIQLSLTVKGKALLKHIIKDHPTDLLNQAFKKLSKEKQGQLLFLLKELTDNLTK